MTRVVAFAIAALSFLPIVRLSQDTGFDPVGTWNISTMSDAGSPMRVTVTIAGNPGAYTGRAVTPQGTLPLQAVATSPNGMIAIFNWAPKGVVVVKIDRTANGGHSGAWAGIDTVYPLTAQHSK